MTDQSRTSVPVPGAAIPRGASGLRATPMRFAAAITASVALLAGCSSEGATTGWEEQVRTTAQLQSLLGPNEYDPAAPEAKRLLAAHVSAPIEYRLLPPIGGNHNPAWATCRLYESPITDELAVHSLEHGAAWVTVKSYPSLEPGAKDLLEELTSTNPYLLVSPYPAQKTALVLSAWGSRLELDSFDAKTVREFVKAYANGPQTPEPGAPCQGGVEGTLSVEDVSSMTGMP